MHTIALGLLMAVTAQVVLPQESPGAALMNASFFGSGAHTLVPTTGRDVRLAVDSAGNRYILWAEYEMETVPHLGPRYAYQSYLLKVAPDNRVIWQYSVKNERLTSLAIGPAGNLTVAGERDASPVAEGFVRRIDTAGNGGATAALWTVPVNGSPTAIATDAQGNIYVTGTPNANFQATLGAAKPTAGEAKCQSKNQTIPSPCADAFVLKLSADGHQTIYATWLGGIGGETAADIAVGPDGSAYVAGETTSPDFPTTPGAAQRVYGGTVPLGPLSYGDGFVTRVDPTGRSLLYSTYLGTAAPDALLAIAVHPVTGIALVGGRTEDTGILPNSRPDALIATLSPTGGLIRRTRLTTPASQDIAVSTSISPDGRMFVGIRGSGSVVELNPETLSVVRRTRVRTYTTPDVAAQRNGVVYTANSAGSLMTGIFAVPAGQRFLGPVYSAQYDFDNSARPSLTAVVNAASYQQGRQFGPREISVAPNQLVTIFGEALPAEPKVMLGGRNLPILYADGTQINTLVPGDLPVGSTVQIVVEAGGITLGPYDVEIAPAVPALFTQAAPVDNTSVVAAINQDGSINSKEHPAPPGSIVVLFGTGLGRLSREGTLAEHLEAYGPGGPGGGMEILYAGEAPGLPGVQQVNVRIHPAITAGTSPYLTLIRLVFSPAAYLERTQSPASIWIGIP